MKRLLLAFCAILTGVNSFGQLGYTGGRNSTKGQCWSIWASNDTAFIGFNDNLYRTYDGGLNWELRNVGIPIGVDPRTIELVNGKLIVGTNDNSRIYRSDDFGDNFQAGTGAITSIAIPTASTSSLNGSFIGGTNFDPHRYDFGTDDWVSTGNGGITHGMRHLGGDTIWICSGSIANGTTSYSHDDGLTWTAVAQEPQTDVGGGTIITTKVRTF